MDLVFATHNLNKLSEVQLLLPPNIRLLSLTDIGCTEEIEETENTLEGNAVLKARYIARKYSRACFADDTGLMVDALNGVPGVYSARYAGTQKNAQHNIDKLLLELEPHTNRTAHFKTVIALELMGISHLFQGSVSGIITTKQAGLGGFGYDPIFQPNGYQQTFAELPRSIKNTISHRAKAFKQLLDFLNKEEYN